VIFYYFINHYSALQTIIQPAIRGFSTIVPALADAYLLVHREPGLGALTHRRNAQQRLPKLLIFLVYCRVQWR